MSLNVDYEKYNANNVLIRKALTENVEAGQSIHDVMVSGILLQSKNVHGINSSRFDDSGFTCTFSAPIQDTIFLNTTFTSCIFDNSIERTKFIDCKFYNCIFRGDLFACDFDNSLLKDCIFYKCKLYGNDTDNIFAARNIVNPAFVDCIMPEYITYDYVYKTQLNDKIIEQHTTIYLFIRSGKLITRAGLVNIDKSSQSEIDEINRYVSLPIEVFNELIEVRRKKLAELVLKGIDSK